MRLANLIRVAAATASSIGTEIARAFVGGDSLRQARSMARNDEQMSSSWSGGPAKDAAIGRWIAIFAGSCVGLLAFVYFALWAFNGFHGLGLDWVGTIALTLGTILSAGLGVGLMGLIFYSDRSQRDGEIGGIQDRR
jgi:hypothetical protein